MDNKDDIADPLAVAQARVDNLTSLLERLMDDDDATVATMQLTRERLTAAIMLDPRSLTQEQGPREPFSVPFQHTTGGIPRQASTGEDTANGCLDFWRAFRFAGLFVICNSFIVARFMKEIISLDVFVVRCTFVALDDFT